MRHRGLAYPFPLAFYALDSWNGQVHECFLLLWDQQRVRFFGIPSIYA